jgi:hypothetical protein
MKIVIETIPHEEQRYPTVGDYWIDEDSTIQVRISEFGSDAEMFAVALHELVELMLCRERAIEFEHIDAFDIQYEEQREPEDLCSEPGNSVYCPYANEHRFAENLERQFIYECGLNWFEYEEKVESL